MHVDVLRSHALDLIEFKNWDRECPYIPIFTDRDIGTNNQGRCVAIK